MMLSSSWMAEKSVLNPFISRSGGAEEVAHALSRGSSLVGVRDDVICTHSLVVMAAEVTELRGAEAVTDEEEEGGGALILPLSEGGIMAAVISWGMSFFRTFSAIRYMARANCSELRRPFPSKSHKFLWCK